jgi:hypothetical protein
VALEHYLNYSLIIKEGVLENTIESLLKLSGEQADNEEE